MSAISTTDLRAAYGTTPVLHGVDLEIDAGEIVSVLGPSGCGKTTLLRVLAGFMRPTSGTVSIGSRLVANTSTFVPPERRRVTIVPQEGALFPHLDVSANISYGIRKAADRHDRVASLLELIGMTELAHARPHELSGGQQQRAALARALAPRPALVLLDEPFSALDVSLRTTLRSQVGDLLRHEGATALIVTHDQHEALSMADRVAVMKAGVLRQIDTPHNVYQRPVDRWVAEFVGDAIVLAASMRHGLAHTAMGDLPIEGTCSSEVLIRPEQLRIDGQGSPAVVTDVEYLGREHIIRARLISGTEVTLRTSGRLPVAVPGATIHLRVDGAVWGW